VGVFGLISTFIVQSIEFGIISRNDDMMKSLDYVIEEKGSQKPCDEPDKHDHVHQVGDLHEVFHSHNVTHAISNENDTAKDVGTITLELGILFHSVIIGVALGVATTEWKSLMIAISFHQMFEGIALGVRIAELKHVKSLLKRLGVGVLYPITTPAGIVIGIVTRLSIQNESETSLLVQGILNSLSAGILMYNTYVELIALEMNQSKYFREQRPIIKLLCFISLYSGAAAMSIIAIWA